MDRDKHVDEKIYCFWTDDNPITPNRLKGLKTMRENLGVSIDFLDKRGIAERILPDAPLHEGYNFLSCNHKSDYLRCYFMHHFGGGYADIKIFSKENNWRECFNKINKEDWIDVIGVPETIEGIANGCPRNHEIASLLIQNSYFICRSYSSFTQEWYQRLLKKMDERLESLKKHPATNPFGGKGYELRWAELQGEIFHSLLSCRSIRNSIGVSRDLVSGREEQNYR